MNPRRLQTHQENSDHRLLEENMHYESNHYYLQLPILKQIVLNITIFDKHLNEIIKTIV